MLLEHLVTFARVVETGSVTQAAQEMGLSQPAVTKRLARLEEEVGHRLLRRGGDRVEPTPAGEVAYRHARRMIDEVQALQSDLRAVEAPGSGHLRLAAVDTMVLYVLPAALAEYRRRNPRVALHVRMGSIQETVDLVLRAEAEVGLTTAPVDEPRLVVHPLNRDPLVVVAAPDVAAALPDRPALADVQAAGLVTYAAGSRFRAFVDAMLAEHGARLTPTMEFDSHEAVRVMALAGYGCALVPETVVRDDVEGGRLVRIAVMGLPPMVRTSALVYRRGASLAAPAARFVELMRARFPAGPA